MNILPGYRFVPKDEELITCYLLRKAAGLPLPCDHILEKNLYGDNANPSDIFDNVNVEGRHWTVLDSPGTSNVKRIFYVFTRLSEVSGNGKNRNITRTAGCGKWDCQTTGKKIFDKFGEEIGLKKTFDFHAGKDDEVYDSWIMHEYSLSGTSLRSSSKLKYGDYVVCKITRTLSKEKFKSEENKKSLSLSEKINSENRVSCMKRSLVELQVSEEYRCDHKKQKATSESETKAANVPEGYFGLDLDEFASSLDKLRAEDEELEEFGRLIEGDLLNASWLLL